MARLILDRAAIVVAAIGAITPWPAQATQLPILVPEPSSLTLLAAGVAGAAIVFRFWRRK